MGKMIDITNQRFGKLLVVSNAGKKDGRRYFWNCLCDCGKTITIEGSRLRSGNTKSCGCGQFDGFKKYNEEQSEKAKIPIGTQYGKLTVIKDLGVQKGRRYYECLCECGQKKVIQGNSLKQEHSLSCGKCISSKGEMLIANILEKEKIAYNKEFVDPQLFKETGRRLRFDFVIYNKDNSVNRYVEFDGRQHYTGPDSEYWNRSADTLDKIKEKDKIKNDFCLKHNIPLVRIPYWITPTKEILFSDKYLITKGEL